MHLLNNKSRRKVSFFSLARIFWLGVLLHFFLSSILSIFQEFFSKIFETVIQKLSIKQSGHRSFSEFSIEFSSLPSFLLKGLGIKNDLSLSKNLFSLSLISIVFFSSLIFLAESFVEKQLEIKSSLWIREKVLDVFRKLPFEQRIIRRDQVRRILEHDVEVISSSWDHIYNHSLHSLISILFAITFSWKSISALNARFIFYFLLWIFSFNLIYFFFSFYLTELQDKKKEHLTKEYSLTESEISKSNLIDAMGLFRQYSSKQENLTVGGYKLKKKINLLSSISQTSSYLFFRVFIFLVILLNSSYSLLSICGSVIALLRISDYTQEIFHSLKDYSAYKSSLREVNEFLQLTEENYNLEGISLSQLPPVKEIIFKDVNFKYSQENRMILKSYNNCFSSSKINRITGVNGSGKSTINYLVLGILKPLSGTITVFLSDQRSFDLNHDVNLRDWKENVICYLSHDNLVESGSTGQRQLANIEGNLEKKKNSHQIFIFDEAGNALDKQRKRQLETTIEKLVDDCKIVVVVNHLRTSKLVVKKERKYS